MTAELTTFVDIQAPPERVWEVLIDVPAWPVWNQFISSAEGSFVVGERLSLEVPKLSAFLRCSLVPLVSRSLNRRYISAFDATNVALKNRIEALPPVRPAADVGGEAS